MVKDLCARAIAKAKSLGATYADVRVIESRHEMIQVKNGRVEAVSVSKDKGFGIRVLARGAWGFASSSDLTAMEVDRIAGLAVEIALASSLAEKAPVNLGKPVSETGRYSTPVEIDPFEVPLEEKLRLLLDADRAMRVAEQISVTESSMEFWRDVKTFANSEGAYIEQTITHSGGGIAATAIESGEVQTRSYPNSFGGDYSAAGYEFVKSLGLPRHAPRVGREAAALLDAPQCPSGEMDLILGGAQLALQIHESCGHPAELDRVMGSEISFAGGSFLGLDKLGQFQYGSECVTIEADATVPGGLGTFGWDDEGVPAQRVPLVQAGRFVGYLSSRETAASIGGTSSGAMRAEGWNKLPIVRMTNINLAPGSWTLDELIRDTRHGIYMETVKSWSIDDLRLNFQFGTEVAYEIVDGKLGRLFKNPTYTGITPEFWRSCDAVCGPAEWRMWGVPNCGKGEPMQVARVGHGTAPARFRSVKVGVGTW